VTRPIFEQTLAIQKAKLGADHPNTLASMNNLANAYRAAGRLDQALPLYEAAVRGVEQRQFQHPHAKIIVHSAVGAFLEARQYHRAHRWRPALVAVAVGPRSPGCVRELASVGQELLQQGHYPEAEELLRQCLNIRVSAQPQAWTTSQTRSLLGAALLGRARTTADLKKKAELWAEAEALLVAGWQGISAERAAIPESIRSSQLQAALDRLIALYTALQKPDEVARWQAERQRLETSASTVPPDPASQPAPP